MSKYVLIKQFSKLQNNTFKKEKDLREFITQYIREFTEDVLEDEYISHNEECGITKNTSRFRSRRMDLVVYGQKATHIIELKNPKYQSENRAAIGQLLCYAQDFIDPKKRLVLISTKFDIYTARAIENYKLPIRYIYFDINHCYEYIGER